jgi:GNAT superfamily N-acetyltransferase
MVREFCIDTDGVPVVSYLRREVQGQPWADRIEVLSPGAAEVVLREMSGWLATGPRALADELVTRGARLTRATQRMTCDLSVQRPPEEWASREPDRPLRLEPADRPAEDLVSAWSAAYAPGHADYRPEYADAGVVLERIEGLVAGTTFGPPSPLSGLVCDGDTVVAGLLVNDFPGDVPWGGLLITDLFRHPAYPGTGTLLLRRTLAHAASAGVGVLGLVVTDGNPVHQLYERHGFTVFERPATVSIP